MSGGQLVVLDRLGRDVKRFPLPEGLATLGSDPACDIRIMLPTVSPHHATVVVHANQTVIRNESTGETLVNGVPVSVAALRHRDDIGIGGRTLRWEYSDGAAHGPLAPQPALYSRTRGSPRRGRRASGPAAAARPLALRLALHMQQRASMPAMQQRAAMPAGAPAKQVAIVQPQRRDTSDMEHAGTSTLPRQTSSAKRSRASNNDLDSSVTSEPETSTRKSNAARPSPRNTSLQSTTKASLWIESRKSSPRKSPRPQSAATPASAAPGAARRGPAGRASAPGGRQRRHSTPLRMAVLRKAQSASKHKVTKIEAPLTVDHTKQAAIMLMTRHTPKKSASPNQPSFVVKKRTPRSTPRPTPRGSRSSPRAPAADSPLPLAGSPAPRSSPGRGARTPRGRASRTLNGTNEVLVVELSDCSGSTWSRASPQQSPQLSPLLPSPKKSALKDPAAKKSSRKTESIKFDLSNLENYDDPSQDVFFVGDVTSKDDANDSQSDTDLTLHYESTVNSPSPRKSIHSRSSKILEKTLGTSISEPQSSIRSTLTPGSPRPRKSSRVSAIVQKALETSGNSRYSQRTTKSLSDESYDTTVASAFKTRTLSPRSPSQKNMESYSIVDLVSVDSNQSGSSSVYNSMQTTKSSDTAFGTPQNSTGRKTRSTIDPAVLTSSTPYVAKTRTPTQRAASSPRAPRGARDGTQVCRGPPQRSASSPPARSQRPSASPVSPPAHSQRPSASPVSPPARSQRPSASPVSPPAHSQRPPASSPRASRARSRYDSDLLLISTVSDDESPRTSKTHSRADKSILSQKSSVISPKRQSRASKSMMSLQSRGTSSKRLSRAAKSVLSPKSPLSSPKTLSRGSKSLMSLKSPSPKEQSRGSKSIQSANSPITSLHRQSRSSKSVSTSQSPVLSPKRQSRSTNSISSPKSPVLSPQRQSRSSKSISSLQSPLLSPQRQSRSSKSTHSPKSAVIGSKRTSRTSKSILSPKSPATSPKRASRATKSKASPPKSPNSSSISPKSATKTNVSSASNTRRSRGTFAMNTPSGSPGNEGVSTPENRHSPVDVGTPVLSIQSLLDSSQSSLVSLRSTKKGRASLKRKTIGGIPPKPKKGRASLKSKSFNFGARRTASRLSKDSGASDKTVEGTHAQEEDIVTPKSAVKLVQEAVKNKHSTAKKPQSKRSMIDDLNDSDIVKQLFNSPVKRKLSQSMSEFSRKQLFDDDEVVVVKRPTRNTVALGQTPDNSILLNQTESYTPEVFVSPLGTPSNSPNLTGIKRLFKKQTPDNDLRNVRGVKRLLRTPRAARPRGGGRGGKGLLAGDLANRLSGVKQVFAASPRNDLRRVSGVKSLFQSQKKGRKSPKNDLRDVRGVKKLFIASSPVNDLRNVSGVKKVLRKNSPRNDLSDLRGVKKMFRQEKQSDNMDVSGIEELFNESNNSHRNHSAQLSESLFDKLVGKPPIKAVYSRTFTKKVDKSRRVRRGGSLHVSIDEIIARPEEWIQKELEKRFEKKGANASSRELQKLATDTVEGSAPVRTARARSSTSVQSSAPHGYSAHSLPLKKRSLAELSHAALPLKKRALVHSTPVKGRAGAALHSELGRVSPIPADDHEDRFTTTVVEMPVLQTTRRSTKAKADSPKTKIASPKSKATSPKTKVSSPKTKAASPKARTVLSKAKVASPKAAFVVISPKKTSGKLTIAVSPRNTRKTKHNTVAVSPKATIRSKNDSATKKPTLVVAKKAPIMSPKLTRSARVAVSPSKAKATTQKEVKTSPQKRGSRKQKTVSELVTEEIKPKSPKRARGKRVSLVVSKPSPKMKPRPNKKQPKTVQQNDETSKVQEVTEKSRRTRKTQAPTEYKKSESPKTTTRGARNRKTSEVAAKEETKAAKAKGKAQKEPKSKKDKSVDEKLSSKTRGKKADVSVDTKKEPARSTRGKKSKPIEQKVESPKRGRKTAVEIEKPVSPKRGRKMEVIETKSEPQRRGRGRKTIEIEEKPASPKRGKKSEVEKPVATRRGRNTELVVEEKAEPTKRGRKTEAKVEQKPVAQRRGRNTEVEVEQKVISPRRGRKGNAKVEEKPVAPTRGRKTEVAQKEAKIAQTRGKRDTSEAQSSNSNVSVSRGRRGQARQAAPGKRAAGGRTAEQAELKPARGGSKVATNRKRKSTAADEVPAKLRKTAPGGLAANRDGPRADQLAPATRKRKTVADTPKHAQVAKRSTRGNR